MVGSCICDHLLSHCSPTQCCKDQSHWLKKKKKLIKRSGIFLSQCQCYFFALSIVIVKYVWKIFPMYHKWFINKINVFLLSFCIHCLMSGRVALHLHGLMCGQYEAAQQWDFFSHWFYEVALHIQQNQSHGSFHLELYLLNVGPFSSIILSCNFKEKSTGL